MTILWILAIVVAFIVGFFLGMWILVQRVKMDLKDPKSELAQMSSKMFDHLDDAAVDTCAKGAEMYQESHRCLNNCGTEIARMLRETQRERSR